MVKTLSFHKMLFLKLRTALSDEKKNGFFFKTKKSQFLFEH
jgi:hypothetical protein